MKWVLAFYFTIVTAHFTEQQGRKQLTMKHTFLDQLCAPDGIESKKFVIYYSISTQPTHTDLQKQYLDSASGLRVSYTSRGRIIPQLWIETIVIDTPAALRRYTVQNATLTTIQMNTEDGISCIDFRYVAIFSGNVYADYSIKVDWL